MRYTYLMIDFFTILVPFIFSFHPKLGFYRTWKALVPAVLITGAFFTAFDSYFTSLGVWGFNPYYVSSVMIGNLPVEEILFFFCIPYACIFTIHCLSKIISARFSENSIKIVHTLLIVISIGAAVYFNGRKYTFFTFTLLPVLIGFAAFIIKVNWLAQFYIIYAILLIPFLIVNGLLTGTGLNAPVVWYNNNELIGIRILTIPLEDAFYGMSLILMNMIIYSHFKIKFNPNNELNQNNEHRKFNV